MSSDRYRQAVARAEDARDADIADAQAALKAAVADARDGPRDDRQATLGAADKTRETAIRAAERTCNNRIAVAGRILGHRRYPELGDPNDRAAIAWWRLNPWPS